MIDVSRRFGENLTEQEAYNIAVIRLAAMTNRSINKEEVCAYRLFDPSGNVINCCVAGYFLKDEEYRASMEECRWPGVSPERLKSTVTIVSSLQRIHDDNMNWGDKSQMKDRLHKIAKLHFLDPSIIDQVTWVPGQA